MNGTIYRIFNLINSKSYIGKTYSDAHSRLGQHIRDAKRHPHRPLYKAFNKYGIENFSFEILGEYPEGELESREIEFITKYSSYGNSGYNATLGGDGKRYINLDENLVVSTYLELRNLTTTAKHFSIDIGTCKKILLANNISIIDNRDIAREKLHKILIVDIGEVFNNTYECAQFLLDSEIVETTSVLASISRSINRVCTGERKSYKGLTFTYV